MIAALMMAALLSAAQAQGSGPVKQLPVVTMQALELSTLPAGSATAIMVLSGTPTQSCLVMFSSVVVGQDVTRAVTPCSSPMTFTLPTNYDVTQGGTITVLWW